MTIRELANISGISIRTLHYYDKIDLLKPCRIEQNGYRQYNEESLKRLQQIMFYKEMDLPLLKIKNILSQPDFNQKEAIGDQMDLLIAKRNRLTKMIEMMEQILKGNNTMDFSVFEHNELKEVFTNRIMQLGEEYRQALVDEYGSIDACIEELIKNEAKIKVSAVKQYGSVAKYIDALKKAPLPTENRGKLQLKLDGLVKQIAACKGEDVSDPKVQKLVNQWKETAKEIFEMDEYLDMFRRIYSGYMNNTEVIKVMDEMYGSGAITFVGKAMECNDIHS